jgi:hypothetical protein
MPTFAVSQSIAAGASSNLLAGTQYEFIPFHAQLEVGLVSTAAGILATVYAGTDLLAQESPLVDIKAAGVLPVYPDNFHIADDCAAGDRINITVRNTTAGALVVIAVIRYNPL